MATGTISRLVHLSNQSHLPGSRVDSQHNDTGYGIIEGDQEEIYFSFASLQGCRFDELRPGQEVRYELEEKSTNRAKRIEPLHDDREPGAGVKNPPPLPEED